MTTASTGVAVIAALTLGLAGCGDNAVDDAFAWRVDLTDLDPALLAAAVTDREIVVVGGGPGGAVLLSWDDATRTWRRPALPGGADTLWWTWIGADDAAIAVGARATVLRRVGGAWQADDVHDLVGGEVTLYGAWGAGADDVWVVGGTLAPSPTPGVVLHFDGAGWQLAAVVDHALYKVWGAAADDLWAVGEAGTILHGDGATWTATTSPTTSRLIAVIGRAGDEVYAVGGDDGGVVLRWDGATWARFATTPARLSGVWTAPGAALFVAGADGYLERFGADDAAPPSATARRVATLTPAIDLHALAGAHGRIVAVGADLAGGAAGLTGTLASHGVALQGAIDAPVDAAVPDAGPDASLDAAGPDASPDAAGLDDAGAGPGPGEPCSYPPPAPPPACSAGLSCYLVDPPIDLVCTQTCVTVADCDAYGAGACCRVPHPQTLDAVCLPAAYCP